MVYGFMIFERWRTYRRVKRTPDLAAETPEGAVARVTGVVAVLRDTVFAPRTGRVCVAWRVRMFIGGGRDERTGGTFEGSDMVPFAIDRPDGSRVIVAATEARYDLPQGIELVDNERWAAYCESRGIPAHLPVNEIALEPGDRVSVVGIVAVDVDAPPPSAEVGYRDGAARALQLAGDFDHPVLIARVRSA